MLVYSSLSYLYDILDVGIIFLFVCAMLTLLKRSSETLVLKFCAHYVSRKPPHR